MSLYYTVFIHYSIFECIRGRKSTLNFKSSFKKTIHFNEWKIYFKLKFLYKFKVGLRVLIVYMVQFSI